MEREVEVREDHVSQLMCGQRPEGMDFNEFRIKRKAIQKFLNNRWRIFYDGKEPYRKPSEV